MALNKTTGSRKESGTKNGHAHKYTPQATKKSGAVYTDMKNGHKHHITRSDNGRVLKIDSAGDPMHTHSL